MTRPDNDHGLSPDEIKDDQFRVENGTAIELENDDCSKVVWWSWDQFVAVHCQHVSTSWKRNARLHQAVERSIGSGIIGEEMNSLGKMVLALPRWGALEYLAERKRLANLMRQRRSPDYVPPFIEELRETKAIKLHQHKD